MTMLSFRVPDAEATDVTAWAERLGVRRSELLRRALRAYLARLAAEEDAQAWERRPLGGDESAIADLADWGPSEDWSDWGDASR